MRLECVVSILSLDLASVFNNVSAKALLKSLVPGA